MNPRNAYVLGNAANWTRVNLLVALYDRALHHCEQCVGGDEQSSVGKNAAAFHRLRVLRILMHLRMGLNLHMGELPQRMNELLEFVQDGVISGEAARIQDGMRVLQTLRATYAAMREEAIELERAGEVPPLETGASVERLV